MPANVGSLTACQVTRTTKNHVLVPFVFMRLLLAAGSWCVVSSDSKWLVSSGSDGPSAKGLVGKSGKGMGTTN